MVPVGRRRSIENLVRQDALDALLITNLANVRYLCGFSGSSGALALAEHEWAFFTDGRYTQQARLEVKGLSIQVGQNAPTVLAARWIAERLAGRRSARVGIEADHLTLSIKERVDTELRSSMKRGYRPSPTTNLVERLRTKKDARETKLLRSAVQLASSVFPATLLAIKPSRTENEVAAELEYLARRAGAERMSFDTIVASGPNSALPHARPTQRRIGHGFVVLDYGVILAGYCSDMTRTIWVGRASREAREIYSAVLEAQLAAIAAVGPGVEAQAVDAAARGVLQRHKLDKYFTHSLGHGVGLEIHETPRLAKGQAQKLEPGMVVTIEPGVYIPGKGGVRIEDMALVTKTGCEVLTPTPKEFLVL